MLNRRNIIGGAAALPVIALASCGVAAPAAASKLSPDFAAVLADAAAAGEALARHNAHVYAPAKEKADALIASLPHTAVYAGPSLTGGQVVWSTDKPSTVAIARSIVDMAREGKDMGGAGLIHARRLTAAHLRRERAAKRIRQSTGLAVASQRSDDLCDAMVQAQYAVALHPVSTGTDLAAKLAFMIEYELTDGMDWMNELHADARRIAGLEG